MEKIVHRTPFSWAGNYLLLLSSGREWYAYVPRSVRQGQGVFRPALEGSERVVLMVLYERVDGQALVELERDSLWERLHRVHLQVVGDLDRRIRAGMGGIVARHAARILARVKGTDSRRGRVWAVSMKAVTSSPLDESKSDPLVASTYPLTPRSFFYPNAIQVVCGEHEGLPSVVWAGIVPVVNTLVSSPENYPVLLGHAHPHGLPVVIEFGGVQQAKHYAIFGPTGSGKSVTAQYLIHELRKQGMRAIVVDVKEEMAKRTLDGKVVGLFDMKVLNPASPANPMLWNAPSAIELADVALEEGAISRKNGRVVFNSKAWARALERAASGILADCQLAASLINHVILGRGEGINPNHLHAVYMSRLSSAHEDPGLRRAIASIANNDAVGFAFHTSKVLAEYVASRLDQKAADTVIGDRAPFRHLLVPDTPPNDESGDLIIQMGGFGVQVDRYGEEAARALYSYLINLIVAKVIRLQRSAAKMGLDPIRFVLYLEEAHRLDPHVIEKAARLFRAFGCSLLVVTQSIRDFAVGGSPSSSPILEQMNALIHMLASVQSIELMLEAYGERIPFPREWIVPEARFGEGVIVTRVGGRPAMPVRFKTAVPREVLEHILNIRGAVTEVVDEEV